MDEWKIGEHTINQDGEVLELLAHENIQETVEWYFSGNWITGWEEVD